MKHLLFAVALVTSSFPVFAADVGVSISLGQPGFYGLIDIGGYTPPQVIYRNPRTVQRVEINRPPVYLHVPPGHRRNWSHHCHKYNACGERVYFVQNSWYDREYVPQYQKRHHDHRDNRDNDHEDRHRGDDHDRQGDDHRGKH